MASVTILFRPNAPAHFVARLGETGWHEGWGWTVEQALEDLARVSYELGPPKSLPVDEGAAQSEILDWLGRHACEPVLVPGANRRVARRLAHRGGPATGIAIAP